MKLILLFIVFLLIPVGCRPTQISPAHSPDRNPLIVSAAVSLRDAFSEIGDLYKLKTGRTVSFNFGASGVLQKQIETGAAVGVFASAGEKQMDELAARGLIDKTSRRDFARNSLVLIVPKNSKTGLRDFSDLAKPAVTKIAVGNPRTVPAGQYSEQLFARTGLNKSIGSKLIFGEHVRQVLDYVVRDETDAGVVYSSDAFLAGDRIRVVATAGENTHDPILYPIALVENGGGYGENRQAREFLELVLGVDGQKILRKHGFAGVAEK